MGLTQGSLLSPILFVVYINNLHKKGGNAKQIKVNLINRGANNFSFTAYDVIIHSKLGGPTTLT